MSNAEARLYLRYFLWSAGSILVAFLLSLATHTADSTVEWGEVLRETAKATAGILTLLLGAMNIPRLGSGQLAEDVDALREAGTSRLNMRPVRRLTVAEQRLDAKDDGPSFLPPDRYPGTHGEGRG